MRRDIFISYSNEDRATAEELCGAFEAAGLECWIAPRNIEPGSTWTSSIMKAIADCRVMVLVFSSKSNESSHVTREILHAVEKRRHLLPVRIENVVPTGGLEYCLLGVQWFDATASPLNDHIASLVAQMQEMLLRADEGSASSGPLESGNVTGTLHAGQRRDIAFECGACGQKLVTDAAAAGQSGSCPRCGAEFTVPEPVESAPPPRSAPSPARRPRGAAASGAVNLDPESVAELKTKFATFVGPLAKLLVDRAAANAGSVPELLELLAAELDSPEDRERFLRIARKGKG